MMMFDVVSLVDMCEESYLYKNTKSFHHCATCDAMLWAELANCRHKNFACYFYNFRIYENFVEMKVKDMPLTSMSHVMSLSLLVMCK